LTRELDREHVIEERSPALRHRVDEAAVIVQRATAS